MAVRYTLREPDPPRAEEPQDIIGKAGLVYQSVILTAPEGPRSRTGGGRDKEYRELASSF